MSALVSLNLLEVGERDEYETYRAFNVFLATSFIDSTIQEHEC